MEKKSKISIIMASYNSVKVIDQAISSVINQSYNNIEFIIIDGGSTDGTVNIIKKYDDKISYWISELDKGIYDAFNKGIRVATGDYIYFLGTDDSLINENVIYDVVNDLHNADIYSGAVCCVEEHDKQFTINGMNETELDMIPHQGMFVRSEYLKKREFDTSYKFAADYEHYIYMINVLGLNVRRTTKVIAFYSLEGISSNNDLLYEYNLVRVRYKLPLVKINPAKRLISKILNYTGLLNWQRKIRGSKSYRKYIKHSCNNKICRWCGRSI